VAPDGGAKQPVAHKEFNCGESWRLCGFPGEELNA